MKIEDFKANFLGGSKPTLFAVEIQGLPEKLKFLCKIAQLPGRTISPITIPYAGHEIKIAGDAVFEDLTVTITLDTDFSVKNEIEIWMENIRNSESSGGQEPNAYKKEGTVIQYNENDEEIASYKFFGLWPTVLDPVELGFDSKDTISEFSVTFSYDFWKREI